jgi:hypothetical protein
MKAVEDGYNNETTYDILAASIETINPSALSHF